MSSTISIIDVNCFVGEYQAKYEQLELQVKQFRSLSLKMSSLLAAATAIVENQGIRTLEYQEVADRVVDDEIKKDRSEFTATIDRKKLIHVPKKLTVQIDPPSKGNLPKTVNTLRKSRLSSSTSYGSSSSIDAMNNKSVEGLGKSFLHSMSPPAPTPTNFASLARDRVLATSSNMYNSSFNMINKPERELSLSKHLISNTGVVDDNGDMQSVESLVDSFPQPAPRLKLQKHMNGRLQSSSKTYSSDFAFKSDKKLPIRNQLLAKAQVMDESGELQSVESLVDSFPIDIRIPSDDPFEAVSGTVLQNQQITSLNEASDNKKEKSAGSSSLVAKRESITIERKRRKSQWIKTLAVDSKFHPKGSLDSLTTSTTNLEESVISLILQHGLNPMSSLYTFSQFLISIMYFTEIWYIPFALGFAITIPQGYSVAVVIFHVWDTILEIFTKRISFGEWNKGATLKDWQRYYLVHGFALDLITAIPFELIIPLGDNNPLWAIKLLRMYKFPRILYVSPIYNLMLKKIQRALGIGHAVVLILPLTIVFCYFLHIQSCVLFLSGRISNFVNEEIQKVQHAPAINQYTWALFAAVGNVFQVGFKPSDLLEQWVVLVFIIIGAGMYASIVGAISSLAMSFDVSGSLYRQKLDELREYMNWKDLGQSTRQKVLKYYDLKYRGKYFEEGTLLDDMNESLRMEISAHNCRDLISKVSFLRREQNDGRDELFMGKIATALVPCYFVAGDVLFTQGQPGSEMFFIQQGSVNVLVQEKVVATLYEGSFFGEIALIANIPRTATIQAASSCMLYRLTRAAFTSILDEFEDVKRTVDVIYRQRMEKIRAELNAKKLSIAIDLASKVPFLNRRLNDGRDEEFFKMIADSLEPVFFGTGDVIFQAGELGNEMYFLKDGTVDILVRGSTVSSLASGTFFGEVALIANIPRTASAHASSSCHLFKLTRDAFLQILNEFKDVRDGIDEIYKERLERVRRESV
ncbi:cyclic nucleotide-binding-like protein [Obelidium mucronatum]|nr:cyclic nucleotide-binding-like protein [Obelidium mucronatum]